MTIQSLFQGSLTIRGRQIEKRIIWIVAGVIVAVLILSGSVFAYRKQINKAVVVAPTPTIALPSPSPSPTPSTAESHLNGVIVPVGNENHHPLAIMVENSPDARPQAGLGSADVVYEAVAEGGITRFMAVFANAQTPVRVGPVRSARPYYVDWATELNAFYAHAGGSADALSQISSTNVYNLDGLVIGSPIFQRDFSRNVALEHTLYTSTDKLWNYATQNNHWPVTDSFQPWLFTNDAAVAARPASQDVTIGFSGPLYAVNWKYDPATNTYARSLAGTPHIDTDTGKQITAKTVIVQTVIASSYDEHYSGGITKTVSKFQDTGSGPATIIQNGTSIKATWKKNGTDRTRYFDESGKEIALVRGTIWVEVVQPDSALTIK